MYRASEKLEAQESPPNPFDTAADAPMDRNAALQQILGIVERWQISPEELIDPAERRAALGNARRLVDFWQIQPAELEGPPPVRQGPQQIYRYAHPKTGETWDGLGAQPAWLRRCLINEGYRLDEVRTPFALN